MFQKISEWLNDCSSHSIYTLSFIRDDFEKHTGLSFPSYVRSYTVSETKVVMDKRGLGGTLKQSKDSERVIWGYVMASDFAKHLVNFQSDKMERGRIFAECVEALAKGGK